MIRGVLKRKQLILIKNIEINVLFVAHITSSSQPVKLLLCRHLRNCYLKINTASYSNVCCNLNFASHNKYKV